MFWRAFDDAGLVAGSALRLILLTGQRPGEVANMRIEHIRDGWWEMPGAPDLRTGWPGTKNGEPHRVWLSEPARNVIAQIADDATAGLAFAGPRGRSIGKLDAYMRDISGKLEVDPVTPHDLRRTFSTKVTGMGFGREALNRVTNHKEGGIATVYDRHGYADENKRVMEAVAAQIVGLAEGRPAGNVLEFRANTV
jgi:integrase